MEEKKVNDEKINATVKSLKWLCNQIPNDLGDSNEERMLKCIKLYCEQGIVVIECLHSEVFAWKQKCREQDKLFEKISDKEEQLLHEMVSLQDEIESLQMMNEALQKHVLNKVSSESSDVDNPKKLELEGVLVVCEVVDD